MRKDVAAFNHTCDRCGKSILVTEDAGIPKEWGSISVPPPHSVDMDLCPKCLKSLVRWCQPREE